uniref:Uncharacterized protein n=1 Tax=Physcomitrium patens TaxID=3218 RepID=A0A2K1IH82_PHYPA|nr:hypothetical protein PHYPA_029224 [Physcomitrium patens]
MKSEERFYDWLHKWTAVLDCNCQAIYINAKLHLDLEEDTHHIIVSNILAVEGWVEQAIHSICMDVVGTFNILQGIGIIRLVMLLITLQAFRVQSLFLC